MYLNSILVSYKPVTADDYHLKSIYIYHFMTEVLLTTDVIIALLPVLSDWITIEKNLTIDKISVLRIRRMNSEKLYI